MVNLADCLVEQVTVSRGRLFQCNTALGKDEFEVISRSSYQPVGQRVILSRGSYKWD